MQHLLIHSSVDGHLNRFLVLLMWMMLQWTQECKYFFEMLISVILDIYSGMEMLDNMVVFCFVLFFSERSPWCSPQLLHYFTLPPTVCMGTIFSISSLIVTLFVFFPLWFFFFFGNSILTSLKLYHIVWICIFLMISWEAFPIPIGCSYVFFGKMANQCSLPIFQYGYFFAIEL